MVHSLNGSSRRGQAVLEVIICLPLILLLTFGGIEFTWAIRKSSEVTTAARVAARAGSLLGGRYEDVYEAASDQMTAAGFEEGTWTLELEPPNPDAPGGTPISVVIRGDYSAVSLGGLGGFLPIPETISGAAVMRKEGPPQ